MWGSHTYLFSISWYFLASVAGDNLSWLHGYVGLLGRARAITLWNIGVETRLSRLGEEGGFAEMLAFWIFLLRNICFVGTDTRK